MKACGLIVEYNPFHNGHVYHLQEAKKKSNADCMIAVMSGSFLQRGEPAIIDKFHRTKAALSTGVDIVLELPYSYAVQSSNLFAKGSVHTLNEIGVDYICFGSESGNINDFLSSYTQLKQNETAYKNELKTALANGLAFPEASKQAYQKIGLVSNRIDLSSPNNILGFSYVQTILENQLPIQPLTIKRTKNNYHDTIIANQIASATSIRKALFADNDFITNNETMPKATIEQLINYQQRTTSWHTWEHYFHLLHYRISTMKQQELAMIQGIDEGIEYRIKKTAMQAKSIYEWIRNIKTKRYTWTRIQRMFVNVLTNTKKVDLREIHQLSTVPYIRLLGMTKNGQTYLNQVKKDINIPLITSLKEHIHPFIAIEEKASNAYYSSLPPAIKTAMLKQEIQPPIII